MRQLECTYNGQGFWSFAHAHWAAFFDLLGWRWVHRPREEEGLPDFILLFESPVAVRVVEYAFSLEEVRWDEDEVAFAPIRDALLVGAAPTLFGGGSTDRPAIGRLRCSSDAHLEPNAFAPAYWITCERCRRPSFFHATGNSRCRVCSFIDPADGARHHGQPPDLLRLWRTAEKLVKVHAVFDAAAVVVAVSEGTH